MKICISCSLSFPDEVMQVAKTLEGAGHEVMMPNGIMNRAVEQPDFDAVAAKHEGGYDSMRAHDAKIREADVLLVCNFTKKGIENYIGANTFLEMGYAYALEKPIYTLNKLPDIAYINDELRAFGVIELNGDLALLTREC